MYFAKTKSVGDKDDLMHNRPSKIEGIPLVKKTKND